MDLSAALVDGSRHLNHIYLIKFSVFLTMHQVRCFEIRNNKGSDLWNRSDVIEFSVSSLHIADD
jgi:hypothetical protein